MAAHGAARAAELEAALAAARHRPASTRARTSTSSRSRVPDAPGRPRARCSTRASWPGCRCATSYPDDAELADALLVCATEVTTSDDIERLRERALADELARESTAGRGRDRGSGPMGVVGPRLQPTLCGAQRARPWRRQGARTRPRTRSTASRPTQRRATPPGLPELTEPEVVRHYVNLSQLNYAVDTGFYPLGSCTMKYNPKVNEWAARLPGFAAASTRWHPTRVAQGTLAAAVGAGARRWPRSAACAPSRSSPRPARTAS